MLFSKYISFVKSSDEFVRIIAIISNEDLYIKRKLSIIFFAENARKKYIKLISSDLGKLLFTFYKCKRKEIILKGPLKRNEKMEQLNNNYPIGLLDEENLLANSVDFFSSSDIISINVVSEKI